MIRQSKRSCDRCYNIKEKCSWLEDSDRCSRCSRLGFICSNTRLTKRTGRRALSDRPIQGNAKSTSIVRALPSVDKANLIYTVMSDYDIYNNFLIGPAFWKCHHATLLWHFERSKPLLEHAFMAYVLSVVHSGSSALSPPHDEGSDSYQHASHALHRLREMYVSDPEQASTCLVLGTNVMLFAMYSRPHNIFTLCRQTLVLVRPVYETIQYPNPADFFFLTGTMMLEMTGCLVYGSVPALKFREPNPALYVDRYLGLSTPLLPLLYQLCELNSAISSTTEEDVHQQVLDDLESTALAWQPGVPGPLCTIFSATEIAHIFCQVQIMRLGSLLIIYRLRFPFGVHDLPARAIATSILTQLQSTLAITGEAVKFSVLPILVACVELAPREREGWLAQVPELVRCSKEYGAFIQGIIRAFLTVRDAGISFRGYNIGQFISSDGFEINVGN